MSTQAEVVQEATGREAEAGTSRQWTKYDTGWTLSLFGTAIGAGILFLPINAGAGGLWPLLIVTALIGPMTYLSHRGLSRLVCASPRTDGDSDITAVVRDYFGEGAGKLITLLYFLAIYPIVLIYGVGITNTVDSLMVNQLGMPSAPRWLLSGVLVALMMGVMIAGQRIMLLVTEWLVYPLLAILLGVTLYLIPSWQVGSLLSAPVPSAGDLAMSVWLIIPVLIFAFNFSPAISQFSVAMRGRYGTDAPAKASHVLRRTTLLLVIFAMGFVWSCVLALGPDGLAAAREANLPVLSYLANVHGSPFIGYLGPAVAIVAIMSSFFGHYLGAAEGAAGIVRGVADSRGGRLDEGMLRKAIAAFIFLTTWAAAIANPSILGLIETLAGPVIASVLYLMPMIAIRRVPALAPYRGRLSNVFVTVAGTVAVAGILLSIVR
ncbi:serine transporter [Kineosphaera limosa]|uniref:Putative serine transporter n=1 Tax=Kineosphaera limosa NBRC 100340 TaxID=1184609 RepID=K6WGG3_9MICO|nr:septum formation initiator [Kineosphaera limosa]NYE02445.1 serine transporter [Kineosphaera limosa]GAB98365.1 putative serine transporter [Kineosphaera limosa NBRC 100340]